MKFQAKKLQKSKKMSGAMFGGRDINSQRDLQSVKIYFLEKIGIRITFSEKSYNKISFFVATIYKGLSKNDITKGGMEEGNYNYF